MPDADQLAASSPEAPPWWKTSVVYQVYIRSFADGDGDGLGDIAGLRARMGHLKELGVDALWINPWYPSPMHDAGYDVADYRAIEPAFGTLADAEAFIGEAHEAGLKVILDIVPNHTSSDHAWFQSALRGDAAARARYIFRHGKGLAGDEPPNDWESTFGGSAWTRTKDVDGRPGDWYLHFFAPEQPDLDWSNPEVAAEFDDILRFWFDRSVDGFRIDVAHGLVKADGLPDAEGLPNLASASSAQHPGWDQDGVHDVYRRWRAVADSYDPPRFFVAEAWVANNDRLARYLRPDELHTAFQFDFLRAPWRAELLRQVIDDAMKTADAVGANSTWVLSNHDVVRHLTRYARSQPDHLVESDWDRDRWTAEPADLELGTRRARAACLLALALPGVAYIYQGEELGLEEVEDLPSELRQDPTWWQSDYTNPGRDGCRVPLPWSGRGVPYGFSPDGAAPAWLPQPDRWAELTVEEQELDPDSTLNLYRTALRLRREHQHGVGAVTWIDSPEGTLAFRRGDVECWINTSESAVDLPAGEVLVCSDPHAQQGQLPVDAAIWLVVT